MVIKVSAIMHDTAGSTSKQEVNGPHHSPEKQYDYTRVVPSSQAKCFRSTLDPLPEAEWTENTWLAKMGLSQKNANILYIFC